MRAYSPKFAIVTPSEGAVRLYFTCRQARENTSTY